MRVEVRCCCDPGKLLGTVSVSERLMREGGRIEFALTPADGRPLWSVAFETLCLPVGYVDFGFGGGHYALKSNDTPVAILRRIPSFIEVVGHESENMGARGRLLQGGHDGAPKESAEDEGRAQDPGYQLES